MGGISVFMALVDFIPVMFFFAAAVLLLKDLYNKMVKGAYSLLAAGSIMVLIGGTYKALWKILYALAICDFPALDMSLFTFQGPGFMLVFAALAGMFTKKNKNNVILHTAAVPVFVSNMPFIILQIIGCTGVQGCLIAISVKMKKKLPVICFILAFIFMMGMGYLGAKFDDSSSMHWLAQCTNIISQGALYVGVLILHRAGLGEEDSLWK